MLHPVLELAVFSQRGTSVVPLVPGKSITIGRAEDCDISIDDASLSRKHAVVHVGPLVEIEDLGGANGTIVSRGKERGPTKGREADTADQARIRGARITLVAGDTVFLGAALLVVRAASAAPRALPEEADGIIVRDPALRRLYEDAARAARLSIPVLILGETGVGKDALARFIHQSSPRKDRPLVALDCAALSQSLAEGELFGHERGAFTGAATARAGLFESADGGTVFLDEIGELPLPTQAKLLRALESAEVTRLGATRSVKVDVRFIAATNRDLQREALAGRFRQDLYFRVNGISLEVPPLRARPTEIAPLAERFLRAACEKAGIPALALAEETIGVLQRYAWPGNVRQLRYVMERAVVTASAGHVLPEHLPAELTRAVNGADGTDARDRTDLASRDRVIDALAKCDNNQTRAAELLGVSRRTLINRMIEFGLPRPRR